MTTITATATAVPPHVFTQADLAARIDAIFTLDADSRARALSLLESAAVERRRSVLPIDELFGERRSVARTAELYRTHVVDLARRAAAEALARARLDAREVDLLITTSCTGFAIPSFDVDLVADLGLRPDVRRLPVAALGCAGGAAALAHAAYFTRARRGAVALVVAAELCTLNLQRDDARTANLVSTALFGDGAAAAVVEGRAPRGLHVVASQSHLFPGTARAMGFDIDEQGFHIVLSREVPEIIASQVRRPLHEMLREHGLAPRDLRFYVLHPGGRRILDDLEQVLGLGPEHTEPARRVLRENGNLSSATVLFVLHEHLARTPPKIGSYGLLAAFGPGLAAELSLLQWTPRPTS